MRLFFVLLVLLSFSGLFVFAQKPPIAVWIDTDPAAGLENRDVDDGLALIQAFHSPELDIRGVSAVFGNTDLENAYPIAQKLTKLYGPPGLEVFKGAAGGNELGKETPASMAIRKALEKEKLTLLVLGPATNIATVLQKSPELASQIKEIIMVAGRRKGQRFTTGTKNLNAHRDFNFELDPVGMQVILDSSVPLVLAPFEISSQVWLKKEDLDKLERGNEACRFLVPPARVWLKLWKDVFFVDGFNPFDTLAVGYLVNPKLVRWEDLPVLIQVLQDDITEERMQGVESETKPYLIVDSKQRTSRRAKYCFAPEPGFKADLLRRLLNQ